MTTIATIGEMHFMLATAVTSFVAPREWCTIAELMHATSFDSIDVHHAVAELASLKLLIYKKGCISIAPQIPHALKLFVTTHLIHTK